jgi:hypothetical protein
VEALGGGVWGLVSILCVCACARVRACACVRGGGWGLVCVLHRQSFPIVTSAILASAHPLAVEVDRCEDSTREQLLHKIARNGPQPVVFRVLVRACPVRGPARRVVSGWGWGSCVRVCVCACVCCGRLGGGFGQRHLVPRLAVPALALFAHW